jgi:hypothetical protein
MNKGLSPELKLAFPQLNIGPLKIEAEPKKSLNPNWVAGFATGEGSFQVENKKSQTSKHG